MIHFAGSAIDYKGGSMGNTTLKDGAGIPNEVDPPTVAQSLTPLIGSIKAPDSPPVVLECNYYEGDDSSSTLVFYDAELAERWLDMAPILGATYNKRR